MVPINEIGEATVRAIAPFVPVLLNKLGEGAIKKAGADAYDTAKGLYQEIWNKAKDDPAAREALEKLADRPESEGRQQVLQEELIALLKREQALAQGLEKSLIAAQLLSPGQNIAVTQGEKSQVVIGDRRCIINSGEPSYEIFGLNQLFQNRSSAIVY